MNNPLNIQPSVGSVIMELFRRRTTYRFFLRSGEHFDIRGRNLKYTFKTDHSGYTQYTIENPDRFFDFLLPELIAIVEVK